MTLEQLQSEMVQAMKNKDKLRKSVLSGMIDAAKKASMTNNGRVEITEQLVDETLLKYKKVVQEQINTCPADRTETLAEYKAKMAVVEEFAPTLIADVDEIKTLIEEYADGAKISVCKDNRGTIMKILSRNLKGKADMGVVNRVLGGMLE